MLNLKSICLASALCCGCGGGSGGGSSNSSGASTPNPWAGTYYGEFDDLYENVGIVSVTISKTGQINGQYGSAAGGFQPGSPASSFGGSINQGGVGEFKFANGVEFIKFSPAGQPTLQGIGQVGAATFTHFLAMVSNPNGVFGGANSFAGDYSGILIDKTISRMGAAAFHIDQSGKLTGWAVADLASGAVIGPVTGAISATGALSYTASLQADGSETITGNVTLFSGQITGLLSDSNGDSVQLAVAQAPVSP